MEVYPSGVLVRAFELGLQPFEAVLCVCVWEGACGCDASTHVPRGGWGMSIEDTHADAATSAQICRGCSVGCLPALRYIVWLCWMSGSGVWWFSGSYFLPGVGGPPFEKRKGGGGHPPTGVGVLPHPCGFFLLSHTHMLE